VGLVLTALPIKQHTRIRKCRYGFPEDGTHRREPQIQQVLRISVRLERYMRLTVSNRKLESSYTSTYSHVFCSPFNNIIATSLARHTHILFMMRLYSPVCDEVAAGVRSRKKFGPMDLVALLLEAVCCQELNDSSSYWVLGKRRFRISQAYC
jgi:hypothetical protein